MSNQNAGWQLHTRGQEIASRRGEILDLESRVDWSERLVNQHEHDIKRARYEAASKAAYLEKRIAYLEKRTKRSERLIAFLGELLIALIAVLFAGLVAAYMHGDAYWKGGGALVMFVAIILGGHFVFERLAVSPPKSQDQSTKVSNSRHAASDRSPVPSDDEHPTPRMD